MGKSTPPRPLVDQSGHPLPPSRPPSWWYKFKQGCEQIIPARFQTLVGLIPSPIRWLVILCGLVVPLLWNQFDTWSRWPLVQRALRPVLQKTLPQAQRFAIAIARLEEDRDDALRSRLLDALHDLPGIDLLRFDRTSELYKAGNIHEAENDVRRKGRAWLQQSGADILLWGYVLPASAGQERVLRLFFTAKDSGVQHSSRCQESQVLYLPTVLGDELEGIIRVQLLSVFTTFTEEHPRLEELGRLIHRVQPLVDGWPKNSTGAMLRYALGRGFSILGSGAGERRSFRQAIAYYHDALDQWPKTKDQAFVALVWNSLGNTLYAQGLQQGGGAGFDLAETAYRQALHIWTRTSFPQDHATVLGNLGLILLARGEYGGDLDSLQQAVVLFKKALEEGGVEPAPHHWAMVKNNLGLAYLLLGERQGVESYLTGAERTFKEALSVWTEESSPGDWAMVQQNLGNTYTSLSDVNEDPLPLKQALVAYQGALRIWTRNQAPLDWAMVTANLGTALKKLGEYEENLRLLEQAATMYHDALQIWTRERAPMDWASTQNNLGNLLRHLGQYSPGQTELDAALIAYDNALQVWTQEDNPYFWAVVQGNRANILRVLASRDHDLGKVDQSVAICREVLKVRSRQAFPLDWAKIQFLLGRALVERWIQLGEMQDLKSAEVSFEEALEIFKEAQVSSNATMAQQYLQAVRQHLGQDGKNR